MDNRDYTYLELTREKGSWPLREEDGRVRVLLVSVNIPGYYSMAVRILALMAASSELDSRYDVRYFELDNNEDPEILAALVKEWRPSILAMSVNIWNRVISLDFIKTIKQEMSALTVIFGGQEVTGAVDDCLADSPELDYIIDGEGEVPFIEFLEQWDQAACALRDAPKVSGLRYRRDGEIVSNGPAGIVRDMDDIPSPILAGLVPVATRNKLGVMIEGARGCPYKCSFCFEGGRRSKVRVASFERMKQEVDFMVARGSTYFHLLDPILSNSNEKRIGEIAGLFRGFEREHKLQISIETYAQHITEKIAKDFLAFSIIDVGLQSINPETVKEIHRSFKMDKFKSGLALFRKHNVPSNIYLICGLPFETFTTFLEGIRFVMDQSPTRIFINELCLLNGTELRRRAGEYAYDFDPQPPYQINASKWMDRDEVKTLNVLAKAIERQYNLSSVAVMPSAPWVRTSADSKCKALVVSLLSDPSGLSKKDAPAGVLEDLSGTKVEFDSVDELLDHAGGGDVDVMLEGALDSVVLQRTLGKLQLSGVARVRLWAPLATYCGHDTPVVEKLVKLGLWHFKVLYAGQHDAGEGAGVDRGSLECLENLCRSYNLQGYASVRPFVDIVVVYNGQTLEQYMEAVDAALDSQADMVTLPEAVQQMGEPWVSQIAAKCKKAVSMGKWLRAPENAIADLMAGMGKAGHEAGLLKEMGLVSVTGDALEGFNNSLCRDSSTKEEQ
ncbi:MAG: B12-binding domain-containing radical SAM protein [Thermodesulfovibrionales bacterium]|nr:B12-binding domain-containing radical SAM protein [Thermodesulfovibrionales bacterium]